MSTTRPQPMSLESFMKTAAMFYIDKELELNFEKEVNETIKRLKAELFQITTKEGLEKYIKAEEKSLERIINLLNISEEKFKRIITMIRVKKGFVLTSEWSLDILRKQMLEYPEWMTIVTNLLMKGSSLPEYQNVIPDFYLDNFSINASTIGRLLNDDDLRRLVKKSLDGCYSNKIGDSIFKNVTSRIKEKCDKVGLTYSEKVELPHYNKKFGMVIPDIKHPRLLIDVIYGITTSSAQTRYANTLENTFLKLRDFNIDKDDKEKIIYINIVDGAGWIARQADLKLIHQSSDYLINLNTVESIDDIIDYYL